VVAVHDHPDQVPATDPGHHDPFQVNPRLAGHRLDHAAEPVGECGQAGLARAAGLAAIGGAAGRDAVRSTRSHSSTPSLGPAGTASSRQCLTHLLRRLR
jgi:hypothetical protein